MSEHPKYDKIEAYLLNRMDDEERRAFEEELRTDGDLKAAFLQQREDYKVMELLVEQDLKKKLKLWQTELPKDTENTGEKKDILPLQKKENKKTRWLLLLVLGIVGIVLIYFLTNNSPKSTPSVLPNKVDVPDQGGIKNPSDSIEVPIAPEEPMSPPQQTENAQPEKGTPVDDTPSEERPIAKKNQDDPKERYVAIADDFLTKENLALSSRTRGAENDSLEMAFKNLENGQFGNAIPYLKTIEENHPKYWDVQYYTGLHLLQDGEATEAVPFLEKATSNIFYKQKAQWYLSLSYLRSGQTEKCKDSLNVILEKGNHGYRKKAIDLKAALDSMD